MRMSPSCNCCSPAPECVTAASWSNPPDGTAVDNEDADIITVDEFDNVQEVELLGMGFTAGDRVDGYTAIALFNDLGGRNGVTADVDMASLFMDDGEHEVRARYENFGVVHFWGFSCQEIRAATLLIQLWRGATLLAQNRVVNLIDTNGISLITLQGSLQGTTFCGGVNHTAASLTATAVVEATTTSTHHGSRIWAKITNKGYKYPPSEVVAITEMNAKRNCSACPICSQCDDPSVSSISVTVPNYKMPLFSGDPIDCVGGTWEAGYSGGCTWSHASDDAEIYFTTDVSGSLIRLNMVIASCLGFSCSGFQTPVASTWRSAYLPSLGDVEDVELTTVVDGVTYTALATLHCEDQSSSSSASSSSSQSSSSMSSSSLSSLSSLSSSISTSSSNSSISTSSQSSQSSISTSSSSLSSESSLSSLSSLSSQSTSSQSSIY